MRNSINLLEVGDGGKRGNGVDIFGSNIFNEKYNAEFSLAGFVCNARPRVYALEAS